MFIVTLLVLQLNQLLAISMLNLNVITTILKIRLVEHWIKVSGTSKYIDIIY